MSDNLHQRSPVLNAITMLLVERFELGADQGKIDQAVYRSRDRQLLVVHSWSKYDRYLHIYHRPQQNSLVDEEFTIRVWPYYESNRININFNGPLTQAARDVIRIVCDGCEVVNPKFVP